MAWKTVTLALCGALAAFGAAPRAAGAGSDTPPVVTSFSPAAVHPGDAFLIDAEFSGRRAPRVWIGAVRIPQGRVRLAAEPTTTGARRLWTHVPKRAPAGEHTIRIATRAGVAAAAKPITVALCDAPPADCGNIPDQGANVVLTGADGYRKVVQQGGQITPDVFPGQTVVAIGDSVKAGFDLNITLEPKDMRVGSVPCLYLHYAGGAGKYWSKTPATVQVAELTATRVGLCIDAVLTAEFPGPDDPVEVTVKGYLVFKR